MNILSSRKIFIYAAMSAVLTLILACSHTPFNERYQPGAETIFLWRDEPIPLEPEWRYLDEAKVFVRGEIQDSILTPVDEVRSLIFVREGQEPPAILILSRVIKTSQVDIFRYLGGNKKDIEGYPYREAAYGLSSDSTDPEYGQYFEKIRAAGLTPAPEYRVRVLDRLPVDTTLVRIMELTPGKAHLTLPAYGKLYPQERRELFHPRPF
ncbi:hypothetical protein H4684_001251 [Desulfomicrobium macestii]|uniref:Lipoprotein n=2 Tax=Desulfomicrobium TaxID=898 RepID=A0A8G2C4J8_DESNO|nr:MULTISPECIES: hypothetical protein [Desulfomicrobium]MBE1424617.1 hypothetical protein [Desulfomicrobium macestii]SFL97426.1 hypothetical protein SAMN05421830_110115 [Desulfomicrobium norvegicum]